MTTAPQGVTKPGLQVYLTLPTPHSSGTAPGAGMCVETVQWS